MDCYQAKRRSEVRFHKGLYMVMLFEIFCNDLDGGRAGLLVIFADDKAGKGCKHIGRYD